MQDGQAPSSDDGRSATSRATVLTAVSDRHSDGASAVRADKSVLPRDGKHRRDLLRDYLLASGSASLTELAQHFGVSVMTVHRDLAELEQQGVVRRFRGGVTAQPSAVFESNVAYRLKAMEAEKDAIAAHALRFVEPGMAILIDDSTTCLALARRLEAVSPLTVVTNQLGSLAVLSHVPGIRLIALGGDYDPKYDSFVGLACVSAVTPLRVDIAFVSAYGVSGEYAYHQEQQIVAGKRAMLASGQRRILLIDHSKLGRVALYQACPLSLFDLVIVDDGADAEALMAFDDWKVHYELAARARTTQGTLFRSARANENRSLG